jgi:hypothetical protein
MKQQARWWATPLSLRLFQATDAQSEAPKGIQTNLHRVAIPDLMLPQVWAGETTTSAHAITPVSPITSQRTETLLPMPQAPVVRNSLTNGEGAIHVGCLQQHIHSHSGVCFEWMMEGCRVGQPTLRWTGRTGLSYLHCTEVGTVSYYK